MEVIMGESVIDRLPAGVLVERGTGNFGESGHEPVELAQRFHIYFHPLSTLVK